MRKLSRPQGSGIKRTRILQLVRNSDFLSAFTEYSQFVRRLFHDEIFVEQLSLSPDSEARHILESSSIDEAWESMLMRVVNSILKVMQIANKTAEDDIRDEMFRIMLAITVVQTIILLHKEICEMLLVCSDDQIDSTIRTACRWGLWRCVGYLLRRKVSDGVRWWVAEQASERATDSELCDYIFPHCAVHTSSIITVVVRRGLWATVAAMLKHGVNESQRMFAIVEAVKRADDIELAGILTFCTDEQLAGILPHAAMRDQWHTVGMIAKRRVGTKQRWQGIYKEASTRAPDSELPDILMHCPDELLDSVFFDVLTRRMWKTVSLLLKRGVSKTLQMLAVEKASECPDKNTLADILIHCTDDQLGSVFTLAIERDLWNTVSLFLERGVSAQLCQYAVEKAMGRERKDELIQILPQCPDEKVETVLDFAISSCRLWQVVGKLLQRKPNTKHRRRAIEESLKYASDRDLSQILIFCEKDEVRKLFMHAVNKGFWLTVHEFLKIWDGMDDTCRALAVEEAMKKAGPSELSNILPYCTDDQLDSVCSYAVENGHWCVICELLHSRGTPYSIMPTAEKPVKGALTSWILSSSLNRRTFSSAEQSSFIEKATKEASDDDLYQILRFCTVAELGTVLTHAVRRGLWHSVGILLKCTASESQQRWAIEEVIQMSRQLSDNQLSDLLPLCTKDQVEACLKLAVTEGWWKTVSRFLKRGLEEDKRKWVVDLASKQAPDDVLADIVFYCNNDDLEEVLTQLLVRGMWHAINVLLSKGVSNEALEHILKEACTRAGTEALSQILTCACKTSVDTVFRFTVNQNHWRAAGELLTQDFSVSYQKWAVEEASKRASDFDFMVYLLPFTSKDQYSSVLVQLLSRGLWKSVNELLQRGIADNDMAQIIEHASKHSPDAEFISVVPYCREQTQESVFEEVVRRNMWKSVHTFLQMGVKEAQRRWAINEACKRATDSELLLVIPHCLQDQLDSVLQELLKRKMWRCVDWLLQNGVNEPSLVSLAITKASEEADDESFLTLLRFCPEDCVEDVLKTAISRSLWSSVDILLQRSIDDTEGKATVQAPAEHLPEIRFPHCVEVNLETVLTEITKRNHFHSVNSLLKREERLSSEHKKYVEKAVSCFPDDDTTISALEDCSYNTLVSELKKATRRGRIKVVKYVCSKKIDVNRHVWAQCFVDLITFDHSGLFRESHREEERIFEEILLVQEYLFRCALAESTTDVATFLEEWGKTVTDFVNELQEEKDRMFPSYFCQYVSKNCQQLPSCLRNSSRSAEVRNQALHFLKSLLALQPFGGFLQSLALRKLEPPEGLNLISHSSAARVWEEERRSLFRTAVEQKNWTVVKQMADHSLYDDQREWALRKVLQEKQWETLLLLSRYGATDDQMMRVHRQVVLHADWEYVRQLIRQGEDVVCIQEELENAFPRGEGLPSEDTILKPMFHDQDRQTTSEEIELALKYRNDRIRRQENKTKLKREELSRMEQQAKVCSRSFRSSLEHRNWAAILYKLRHRESSKDEFYTALEHAIREKAWYIVYHLVRLRKLDLSTEDAHFDELVTARQWGVLRIILEKGPRGRKCQDAVPKLIEERQWILLALIMEILPNDDERKMQIMQEAISNRESSVVALGLTSMRENLDEEKRELIFQLALSLGLWQCVGRCVQQNDIGEPEKLDKVLHEAMTRQAWDLVDICLQNGADIDVFLQENPGLVHLLAKNSEWDTIEELLLRSAHNNPWDARGAPKENSTVMSETESRDTTKEELPGSVRSTPLNAKGASKVGNTAESESRDATDEGLPQSARSTRLDAGSAPKESKSGDTTRQLLSTLLDARGASLLENAIESESWDAVKMLIRFHGDINSPGVTGKTPLFRLIQHDQCEVIDYALDWVGSVAEKVGGKSAVHVACVEGMHGSMKRFVARGADPLAVLDDGESVLSLAVKNKQFSRQLVSECIKMGLTTFQPEISDRQMQKEPRTYPNLHRALNRFCSPFERAVKRRDLTLMRMLHESGSCSNAELHRVNTWFQMENTKQKEGEVLETLTFLQTVSSAPRTLKSMCRLLLSHHIGVGKPRKREAKVNALHLQFFLKQYVLFADILEPEFNQ